MTFMAWSDNYLTGIDAVDHQHKILVEMINDSAPILAANPMHDVPEAAPMLDALIDYVGIHFSTEDRIMVERGIDPRHLQHHRQSHQAFAEQVFAMRHQFEQNGDLNGNELLRFLSNWLAFHILGEDQRMARELTAIDQGMGAAEAFDQTEGSKAEILQGANDVLVNALVNLFAQMTEQNRALAEKNDVLQAAHRELDHHRRNLEQQVSLRTAELVKAKEAAEAASRAKSRFLGSVSHELLTPLNAIVGFAHLLERVDIPPKQKEQAGRIVFASERLKNVLNEVLQFSRLEAGEVNIDYAPFMAASLLTQIADRIQKSALDKGLSVTTEADPQLPYLLGDQRLLGQAMEALANNAVKFTEQGFIKLRARILDRQNSRFLVSFDVEDTGAGIPPERQNDLFKAFEQLDSTTTRHYQGIGLGLVISSRLTQLLGGELTMDSQAGGGSVFRIGLWLESLETPLAADAGTAGLEQEAIGEGLNRLKLLLAQSNIVARKQFAKVRDYLHGIDAETTTILARQIDNYEFDDALLTFNRLVGAHGLVLPDTE